MARLIDAGALLQSEVKRCRCIPTIGSGYNNETSFKLILDEAPTVDAVPVVHGRWVNVQTLGSGCVGFCSNCMTPHKANNATALRMDYRHCRWCGAKMDGERREGE